jgi:hypothetical protein
VVPGDAAPGVNGGNHRNWSQRYCRGWSRINTSENCVSICSFLVTGKQEKIIIQRQIINPSKSEQSSSVWERL